MNILRTTYNIIVKVLVVVCLFLAVLFWTNHFGASLPEVAEDLLNYYYHFFWILILFIVLGFPLLEKSIKVYVGVMVMVILMVIDFKIYYQN